MFINDSRMFAAADVIISERVRQLELQKAGRFKYTLSDDGMTDFERFACLGEEYGEVCRNILRRAGLATDGDLSDDALLKELSQIAALALAWMERLVTMPGG
jgi:hypothetical protein